MGVSWDIDILNDGPRFDLSDRLSKVSSILGSLVPMMELTEFTTFCMLFLILCSVLSIPDSEEELERSPRFT